VPPKDFLRGTTEIGDRKREWERLGEKEGEEFNCYQSNIPSASIVIPSGKPSPTSTDITWRGEEEKRKKGEKEQERKEKEKKEKKPGSGLNKSCDTFR
jgi:hypothetical protein